MQYDISGKLVFIGPAQQVTETFKKKEFAIELSETVGDKTFTNYVKMQLTQAKTDLLNGFGLGDVVKCHFNLRGNKSIKNGTTNYFTNIEAWKIEAAQSTQAMPAGKVYQAVPVQQSDITPPIDDLPF